MYPLIAIVSRSDVRKSRIMNYVNQSYIRAVEDAGGLPILVPLVRDLNLIDTLLPRVDGVLLTGGNDVSPQFYNEEPHASLSILDEQLDRVELALTRRVVATGVPLLGICRGMQVLDVALGGTLFQDLATECPESLPHANWKVARDTIAHSISVDPGSRMAQILGETAVPVNSLHHQAIKTLGVGLQVSGRSEDGVIECVESTERPFLCAVQCHPEELYSSHQAWANLFTAFIAAASANAHSATLEVLDTVQGYV